MSDRVMQQLEERFITRMREWAREKLMPGGSVVPSSWPSDGPRGQGGAAGSGTPIVLGRFHDTEAALAELREQHAREEQAVRWYWLYEGTSLTQLGRRRGVSDNTFATWCINGHRMLGAIFFRQSERWHQERAAKRVTA